MARKKINAGVGGGDSAPLENVVDKQAVVAAPLDTAVSTVTEISAETDERAERLGALRREVAALREDLSEIQSSRRALQQQELEISERLDSLTSEMEAIDSHPNGDTEAIQAYIKRSAEVRAASAARRRELLEIGVGPNEIVRRVSPIDAALARNARRGNQRPAYSGAG